MPTRIDKATQAPATAYNVEVWMQGLEEEAPNGDMRNGEVGYSRSEQRSVHCQDAGQGSTWCRWQERPWFPSDLSGGSPSSGDESVPRK